MIFQRKYGTLTVAATHVRIPIVKRGVVDYALNTDWTPASGDVQGMRDGSTIASITNDPTAVTTGNTALWVFILTATELMCKQLMVMIVDQTTPKVIEDQCFIVETYGHPSAMYPSDIGADNTDAENRFLSAVKGNVLGTVGSNSTTTSIITSELNPANVVTDQFKGRILTFAKDTTTVNLRGQGTNITASGVVLNDLTVTALSTAPVSGDTFTIT